ncbi:MAG: polyprenol monophosphomannose synthase [Candidatus Giovannonibacteria bacterium]|nr:MAG: polyprenol monophosphomannose synthase [Candidatus Giovannonibacteria bacterium]
MKIVVIIPTYNEKESVGGILEALCGKVFKAIQNHEMKVLVVDGNSPDGTAEAVAAASRRHQNIFLIKEKEKRGIGAAYVAGMKYAIEKLGADAVVEFDGDWQHNPEDIKRLVAEFDKGYDYIIGSRYVPGGSIPKEWALWRKFLSRLGGFTAKFVLGLPVNDTTSGLKLSRVKNFAELLPLDENKVLSKYYAYKIQFLYEMLRRGAKTKEIPIQFLERRGGSSKSTLRDIFDSLRVVFALKFKKR